MPLRLPWPPVGSEPPTMASDPPRLEGGAELQSKGLRSDASRDLKHLFRMSATSSEASEPLITSAPDTNPPTVCHALLGAKAASPGMSALAGQEALYCAGSWGSSRCS